ncbi:nitroreductase/quinone reductase family protein [Crossiella cryophila]|uniref:Deazaflavin-dependent oxidoreductase (Nitroreductase family) n=1 Tax=Crossiella cryophila TaxID=43355 RepID=A0A7W7FSI1_9PSEU|nr:nitroreductase/quinone reductase family protein [Crossiella cryophila]MBB4677091.1 deazaflavin-dependent oxidoreductase (nitroreductase family) [Crossiella cryophila]
MDFNKQVIEEFRANNGRVGGYFEGSRLLLITTTGARSGKAHTNPVGYYPDGDGRSLIIGSAGGSPKHPDWYHNLVANPELTVEDGVFTYEAKATVLTGEARDQAFARAVEADEGWAEYQSKTTRVIPVVILEATSGGPPNAGSASEALKLVHNAFRRELAMIRSEFAKSGRTLGVQLRINCLTLCQGLHNHHTGEDMAIFPYLGDRYPEFQPTIDRLREEHVRIADLTAELQRTLDNVDADPAVVLTEVERLTNELERHLDYEEAQLIPVLEVAMS